MRRFLIGLKALFLALLPVTISWQGSGEFAPQCLFHQSLILGEALAACLGEQIYLEDQSEALA